MIEIKDVSFDYRLDSETLRRINLSVAPGECVLLCGESGCGKTTVTKLINGLIPHFTEDGILSGQVTAAGMSVADTGLYRLATKIGSVFQNPKTQFFNLESDAELVFGLENEGVNPEKIRSRMRDTVDSLQIQRLTGRNIFAMSGGEKQSLAFASVYAMNPEIYVLDEPTANLDGDSIDTLRRQIVKIKAEGHTVVIAEHRLYFLFDLIDRAVFFKKGRIVREYSGPEFRKLNEKERISKGLRSLHLPIVSLPPAAPVGNGSGLSVEDLICGYTNHTVLIDVGFFAARGQITGITGPNGIGKTTLTRCIAGLLKQRSGCIRLDGQVLSPRQRNKACFCVMQDVNRQLFADSVWEECEMTDGNVKPERIKHILQSFDLLEFKDSHPMALSGGQKQRLAVATAVLAQKQILIFDEPTSGLDYRHMIQVSQMLRKLAQENHIVLVVTHDQEFISCTCDRIYHLGKAVNSGTI